MDLEQRAYDVRSMHADYHHMRSTLGLTHFVSWERPAVVDHKVWLSKLCQLLLCGPDQHVVHEQGVVGSAGDDTDLHAELL